MDLCTGALFGAKGSEPRLAAVVTAAIRVASVNRAMVSSVVFIWYSINVKQWAAAAVAVE